MAEARLPGLGAVILCGGQSRRMGTPKEALVRDGETLLARTVRIAGTCACPVVVVGAPGRNVPPLPGDVEVVADREAHEGPLSGLVTGLRALSGRSAHVFVGSCDMPFLEPTVIRALAAAIGGRDVACVIARERRQPLAAVYAARVAARAERLLQEGDRRMMALLDACDALAVAPEALGVDPETVANVNTPEDWARALRRSG